MESIKEKFTNFAIEFKKRYLKIKPIIISIDIIYISVFMILPFVFALNNVGHFEKISANQMLTYIGSMSTAFCTINLSFITFWFAVNSKRESDKLKKRVILNASMYEDIFINQSESKITIEIPLKATTEYINSVIIYDVTYIRIASGILRRNFCKGEGLTQIHSDKNTSNPILLIELTEDKINNFKFLKYIKLNISVTVINEGIETKNELAISAESTDVNDPYFKIIKEYQLWSM